MSKVRVYMPVVHIRLDVVQRGKALLTTPQYKKRLMGVELNDSLAPKE